MSEPPPAVDRDLAENLVDEIKTLLANHNLLEAVVILRTINTSLAADRAEAAAEPMVN